MLIPVPAYDAKQRHTEHLVSVSIWNAVAKMDTKVAPSRHQFLD
jgi:hypothetical protein